MIGWKDWIITPPPRGEIVECKREGYPLHFWVKPELLSPEWNIWGVAWHVADELLSEDEFVEGAVDKSGKVG